MFWYLPYYLLVRFGDKMAIEKPWKIIFKALSNPNYSIKENYELHRKVISASRPYFKPFYKVYDRKILAEHRNVPIRIFKPNNRARYFGLANSNNDNDEKKEGRPNDIIVFFHGGGWVTGNVNNYTGICSNMANQTNCIVISVEYRLAPEHPFPAGLEDCYNVTKVIASNIIKEVKEEGKLKEPRKLIISGDSAGGNLAAVISLLARDSGDFMPDKQILYYPSCYNDYSDNSPFESVRLYGKDYILTSKRIREYMELYVQSTEDLNSPLVAPLLAKDFTNQPDTLIITAEYDPLRDEGEAYGLELAKAGNNVQVKRIPDSLHGFLALSKNSEIVETCYQYVREFLTN